jgi:threonine/homoserine/homoserine lactone efflux protein
MTLASTLAFIVAVFVLGITPGPAVRSECARGDIAILVAVIAGVLTTTNRTYGLLAARARALFKSRRVLRNFNRAAGALLAGAGIAVATR